MTPQGTLVVTNTSAVIATELERNFEVVEENNGAVGMVRTHDLRRTRPVLYQLSCGGGYSPIYCLGISVCVILRVQASATRSHGGECGTLDFTICMRHVKVLFGII